MFYPTLDRVRGCLPLRDVDVQGARDREQGGCSDICRRSHVHHTGAILSISCLTRVVERYHCSSIVRIVAACLESFRCRPAQSELAIRQQPNSRLICTDRRFSHQVRWPFPASNNPCLHAAGSVARVEGGSHTERQGATTRRSLPALYLPASTTTANPARSAASGGGTATSTAACPASAACNTRSCPTPSTHSLRFLVLSIAASTRLVGRIVPFAAVAVFVS